MYVVLVVALVLGQKLETVPNALQSLVWGSGVSLRGNYVFSFS